MMTGSYQAPFYQDTIVIGSCQGGVDIGFTSLSFDLSTAVRTSAETAPAWIAAYLCIRY
jgi:hypothetical protein